MDSRLIYLSISQDSFRGLILASFSHFLRFSLVSSVYLEFWVISLVLWETYFNPSSRLSTLLISNPPTLSLSSSAKSWSSTASTMKLWIFLIKFFGFSTSLVSTMLLSYSTPQARIWLENSVRIVWVDLPVESFDKTRFSITYSSLIFTWSYFLPRRRS